ncbi:MAG: hypothetical protein EPO35_04645 [Acidobacteria bacterium]|nr:MAG: hypothetical protein EPO35_04645 [Acidobacteriota bacterium]
MSDGHPVNRRLDSWKAIAEYLGRDVRTALRWHRRDGLPVHRISGSRGRAVHAYTAEIDTWLAAGKDTPRSGPPSQTAIAHAPLTTGRWPWRVGLTFLAAAALVFAVSTILWGLPGGRLIARAVLDGDTLIAYDGDNREVWRHSFGHLSAAPTLHRVGVGDLDGDHKPDVVASVVPWRADSQNQRSELIAISSSGRALWQRTLDDAVSFDGKEYAAPWFHDALIVYSVAGQARITLAAHHHIWWPDLIVTLDGTGKTLGTFVNTGWIDQLVLSSDGRHLIATGVNNVLKSSVLAALDVTKPLGQSPAIPGGPICTDCPAGSPDLYLAWPRTELADPAQAPPTMASVDAEGRIQVRAIQRRSDGGPELIAELSPAFVVLRQSVSDSFQQLHERLETSGTIKHDLAHCPSLHAAVQSWTPTMGWGTYPFSTGFNR